MSTELFVRLNWLGFVIILVSKIVRERVCSKEQENLRRKTTPEKLAELLNHLTNGEQTMDTLCKINRMKTPNNVKTKNIRGNPKRHKRE